ncbi:hypothetical protein R6Q59_030106 [Mikania micrantha]
METSFLFVFTFLLLQRFGSSITATSSNVTCVEGERRSLLAIKHKIIDRFNLLSTWSGVECCEWRGVGCDTRNGHVVKLDLRSSVSLEDLNKKWLEGELSPWLQNLKHLRYLDLSMNNFSGKIPEFFGSFKRLEYLNLSGSCFSEGVVPHHLGNLSRLQVLDLRSGFIFSYGVIYLQPPVIVNDLRWVSSLSSLRYLDLSGISIGKLTDWFHPINMLPSLLTLNLASSLDSNTIPSVKPVNFTSLNSLDLSMNGINSTIPLWLSNLTGLMHLNLRFNRFHDKIPDFIGTFNTLASIDLSYNSFKTLIPDPLCNLSSLVRLDLSFNKFFGPVPSNFGLLLRLEYLDLGVNQVSGNITMANNLVHLDLSSNMFSGPVPSNFGLLSRLEYLNLGYNQLSGNIPMVSNLVRLDLSRNLFSGPIPSSLGLLSRLEYLNLGYNQLSGNIPMSLGEIPDALMNLVGLKNLNLSRNQLKGQIPMRIGNLNQLESLDLSMNMLSGHIPQSLTSLNFLSYLNLSFNNLSGPIPVGNQLQTLAYPSCFQGNDGLCGPPLSRSCKGDNSSYDHVGKVEAQDEDEDFWLYIGMGTGFVVGFIGLLGSLHFIRSWRVAYFEMLENFYTSILVNLACLRRTCVS